MAYAASDFHDGLSWTGAGDNQAIGPFQLLGGLYCLLTASTGTNSVQLNAYAPDGTTLIPCSAAAQTAGYAVYSLPPGNYNITGGAAYSVGQGALIKVPYRSV
jgi:hypothetical protein